MADSCHKINHMQLKDLLNLMVEKKASYLHVTVGLSPQLRIDGKLITTLVDGIKSTGEHVISWAPNQLPDGIYYYVLDISNTREIGEIMKLE